MTERQLFAAIGEIDENMIAQANREPERRSLRWLAAAAALTVTVGALITFFAVKGQKTPPVAPPDPPPATRAISVLTTTATESADPTGGADPTEGADPTDTPSSSGTVLSTRATSVPTTTATETADPTGGTHPTGVPLPSRIVIPTHAILGPDGLPLLSLDGLTDTGYVMGGNGYVYAPSADDIRFAQAWEEVPETLPVWQILLSWFAGDYTAQTEAVRRVAQAMGDPLPEGAEFTSYRVSDSLYDIEGRESWISTERFQYYADSNRGCLTVFPLRSLDLGKQADWAQTLQTAFPGLFAHMKTPAALIAGGDHSWGAENGVIRWLDALWTLYIYDAEDPEGPCAAFLKGVQVSVWEDGSVASLYVYLPELYVKLGDYPVLSRNQALAALEKQYGSCRVLGSDLVYEGLSVSYFRAPVWRFLLQNEGQNGPSMNISGMTAFALVYVPAIPSEYLVQEPGGETHPTGYPSGEMQCEMLYFEGKLYTRDFLADPVAEEDITDPPFILVGKTAAEINDRSPDKELAAARAPVGTPVYLDDRGRPWLLKEGRLLLLRPCTEKD